MPIKTAAKLVTTAHSPLEIIESQLLAKQQAIETWLRDQWRKTPAPFYGSVDLRNAGFKLAPVDTNLFPAGFNNLSDAMIPMCIQAVQSAMERVCPKANNLLLIPENHSRNQFYLESLARLVDIIRTAGFTVRIGSLSEELLTSMQQTLPSGKTLTLEPIKRIGNKLSLADYNPCAILLNNDLSGGRPAILENLEQPVIPPLELGWSNRLKSGHFAQYRDLAQEFAEIIDIDPWLIDPMMRNCGQIDFMKREGTECLETHVGALLTAIQKKYDEYGIDKKPFVFIKADAGTYGMGIMTVTDVSEVSQLNRKQRTKMDSAKEGKKVDQVIIQEGVYTTETVGDNAVAEPVIYMIDHFVVGGFYRVNSKKAYNENLNSPGMTFEPMPFSKSCVTPDCEQQPDAEANRFYTYGVIARLALLASAREIATAQQKG